MVFSFLPFHITFLQMTFGVLLGQLQCLLLDGFHVSDYFTTSNVEAKSWILAFR